MQLLLSILILAGCVLPAMARFWPRFKPEAIDVSSYPPELQRGYKLFEVKCSACHSLSVSLQQPRSEAGWVEEVHRMRAMASSHINRREADEIAKFLSYHEALDSNSDETPSFPRRIRQ